MVNHEGKANRRFQPTVQVRKGCLRSAFKERRSLARRQTYLSSDCKIRDKTFVGALV
jgi:hypothetical protein